MIPPGPEKSRRKRDSNPGSSALEADALTTRPTRRSPKAERHGLYVSITNDLHSAQINSRLAEVRVVGMREDKDGSRG